jgi:hypothetical protein
VRHESIGLNIAPKKEIKMKKKEEKIWTKNLLLFKYRAQRHLRVTTIMPSIFTHNFILKVLLGIPYVIVIKPLLWTSFFFLKTQFGYRNCRKQKKFELKKQLIFVLSA